MRNVLVGELQREDREDRRATSGLAGELLAAAQAQAALLADLDEVVEEADRPSPVIRNSTSRPLTVGRRAG